MALLKTELLYNGETVRYHRIAEYIIDQATGDTTAVLHSFRDQEHRNAHPAPLVKRSYSVQRAGGDLASEAYAAIKSRPEWAGAQDA